MSDELDEMEQILSDMEPVELPDVLSGEELDEMLSDDLEEIDVPDPDLDGLDFPDLDDLPEPEPLDDLDDLFSDFD